MRPRLLIVSFSALAAASTLGCQASTPPERRVDVSNAGFRLDQLFTDDRGYTVNRFYDKGEYRYYVVSPDGHPQMLPTTKTVREPDRLDPGVNVGIGIGSGGTPRR